MSGDGGRTLQQIQLELDAEFAVPNTKAVQVFVPIQAQGQEGGTSIVDSRAYRVDATWREF